MLFTPDTEMTLQAMAVLVNSAAPGDPESQDTLTTLEDLRIFLDTWRYSGRFGLDAADLAAVRALRPRLARLWGATEEEAVELTNTLLREYRALPQLVRHDEWDWHLHAKDTDEPIAERVAVEAAMAMVDVIRAGELSRFQICVADDCEWVLVDLSKNRSRRFCGTICSNRVSVAAYRARKAART